MFGKNFWKQVGERAVKTVAQVLVLIVAADGFNVLDADWKVILSSVLSAALLSVLTSIVTSGIGQEDSPSAVTVEGTDHYYKIVTPNPLELETQYVQEVIPGVDGEVTPES